LARRAFQRFRKKYIRSIGSPPRGTCCAIPLLVRVPGEHAALVTVWMAVNLEDGMCAKRDSRLNDQPAPRGGASTASTMAAMAVRGTRRQATAARLRHLEER